MPHRVHLLILLLLAALAPSAHAGRKPPTPQQEMRAILATSRAQLDRKLLALTAEHVGVAPGKFGLDSRLVDDLHADDLDLVELTLAVEDAFYLCIPDALAPKTARDLADYVFQNRQVLAPYAAGRKPVPPKARCIDAAAGQ